MTTNGTRSGRDGDDGRLLRWVLWSGLVAVSLVFGLMPELDLQVSACFWRSDGGFIHAQDAWVLVLYDWTQRVGRGLLLVLLGLAVAAPWLAQQIHRRGLSPALGRWLGGVRRPALLALLAAVLANGIIIDGVLKNTMGRPRPVQIEAFGGTAVFHGLFRPGDDTGSHRSFTTGHGAAAFSLMCLGLGCQRRWRRRWFGVGIALGSVVGLARILQGGHFLSDVIFSFYVVWLSCELVAWLDRRWRVAHDDASS